MTPDQACARAFPIVWRLENGGDAIVATDTPGDDGGYTRGGVALNRHPELTRVQLDEMTYSDFAAFYRREYWSPNGCDVLPWPLSLLVFDGEVNEGGKGAEALQAALGVRQDGDIGPVTLAAAAKCDAMAVAARALMFRDRAYHALPDFPTFGNGWITRLFTVALEAFQPV